MCFDISDFTGTEPYHSQTIRLCPSIVRWNSSQDVYCCLLDPRKMVFLLAKCPDQSYPARQMGREQLNYASNGKEANAKDCVHGFSHSKIIQTMAISTTMPSSSYTEDKISGLLHNIIIQSIIYSITMPSSSYT